MSICYDIVIPAYNAHAYLPDLLHPLSKLPHKPDTIFLVDDGSDRPYCQLSDLPGLKIKTVRLSQNRGKGYALRKGMELFLNKNNSSHLLLMDADGQHPVGSINAFLQRAERCDVLIGKRQRKPGKMPLLRIFSNTLSSLILSWVTQRRIADSQCGFRLLHRRVVQGLQLREEGFQVETEMILQLARSGEPMEFVPIPTLYNGQKSYIRHFGDTLRFLQLVLREVFRS